MNTTELKFKNLVQLQKHFSNKQRCVEHLEQLRWSGEKCCVHCGSVKIYVCKGFGKYKCGDCKSRFSVTSGTFFENTKIPLTKWFVAMYLCLSHKKGVSSCQLARDLGVTQKTAWFILHRIRQLVISKAPAMLLDGMVEIDETYLGGKEKNKHANKKLTSKGSEVNKGKSTIVGAVQRNGSAIAKFVPNANKKHLLPFIKTNIKPLTTVYTDEWYAYGQLNETFNHDTITHSKKEYVRGNVHTNTIENFWSVFKRTIYGTYHQVSDKHLQQYANEICFRYSTRKQSEQHRFDNALGNCDGRLKYAQLIQK